MSDDQFASLSKQISDLSGQFLKLYQHFEQRFDTLQETKADKTTVDHILHTVDGIAARLEIDDHERLATASQLHRHESWIKQLAKETTTKLVPEP